MSAVIKNKKKKKKHDTVVAELKHQSSLNSAMKQCNDVLELKIQQLKAERAKILNENKRNAERIKTLESNHISSFRLIRIILRNQIRRITRENQMKAFYKWKLL